MKIGIIAGEASGDLLAAGLIKAIQAQRPEVQFEGIAGPAMIEAGCHALYPSEKLAVMGLAEVFKHYRELKRIQDAMVEHFSREPPAVFIGVDAPDFNLTVARKLKARGIPTVHYVSPSVWAWRQYRVKKIGRAVDLMLTLFPFEAEFYRRHDVRVRFVGHPLADMIPLQVDAREARRQLGLTQDKTLVALLPGSRLSEARQLTEVMLLAARRLADRNPDLEFVMPLATSAIRHHVEALQSTLSDGPVIHLVDGQSRVVMAAVDAILLASGTAALEAMLFKKPMVVTYKVAPLTYVIVKRLIKTPYISLPNILAGEAVARELIQAQATPEALADELERLLQEPEAAARMRARFDQIHRELKQGADRRAAEAVLSLIGAQQESST